jgi:hypothetical protein
MMSRRRSVGRGGIAVLQIDGIAVANLQHVDLDTGLDLDEVALVVGRHHGRGVVGQRKRLELAVRERYPTLAHRSDQGAVASDPDDVHCGHDEDRAKHD